MYHFFVDSKNISTDSVIITGNDVNHIKNVLRMKTGEEIVVSDSNGASYCCSILELGNDRIIAKILDGQLSSTELPVKLILFQGLPKSDKMELIIQKAVELGVYEIIPVEMSRSVVKLDDKKKKSKVERWQSISESAAKQSGRAIIPVVHEVVSFNDAVKIGRSFDVLFAPYECSDSMKEFQSKLKEIKSGMSVGIFIGPEGGYEESEIEKLTANGASTVSLGKRILRTETAGIAALSICMFNIETNLL
jgi:16S rRNA (uracil1498-N3)-methyltransferase